MSNRLSFFRAACRAVAFVGAAGLSSLFVRVTEHEYNLIAAIVISVLVGYAAAAGWQGGGER